MNIHDFVDCRLLSFRDRTASWGTDEAVELQAMQLIEVEAHVVYSAAMDCYASAVHAEYIKEVRQRDPKRPTMPLYKLCGNEFGQVLHDVCMTVRRTIRQRFSP